MRTFNLSFAEGELIQASFKESASAAERVSVRGKVPGAYRDVGTFQWTSAVRAVALLALRAAISPQCARISGGAGSPASSLDYALSKQPLWLLDLFGCDRTGVSYARRIFLRTNSERKRPGPVVVALNDVYLPSSSIGIFLGADPASPEAVLALCSLLAELDSDYEPMGPCNVHSNRAVGE